MTHRRVCSCATDRRGEPGSPSTTGSRQCQFDRQGRRLGVLGVGVLGVLAMTTVFTLRDFGSVVMALANSGASVWALCGFVLAMFAGIARVIRAFDAAMSAVERIVKLRDPSSTGRRSIEDHHPSMLSASAAGGKPAAHAPAR